MIDKNFFNDISQRLTDSLPEHVNVFRQDIKKNFHFILQAALARLDLVTREEFDIQTQVLAKTREKVEQLSQEIKNLEEKS